MWGPFSNPKHYFLLQLTLTSTFWQPGTSHGGQYAKGASAMANAILVMNHFRSLLLPSSPIAE